MDEPVDPASGGAQPDPALHEDWDAVAEDAVRSIRDGFQSLAATLEELQAERAELRAVIDEFRQTGRGTASSGRDAAVVEPPETAAAQAASVGLDDPPILGAAADEPAVPAPALYAPPDTALPAAPASEPWAMDEALTGAALLADECSPEPAERPEPAAESPETTPADESIEGPRPAHGGPEISWPPPAFPPRSLEERAIPLGPRPGGSESLLVEPLGMEEPPTAWTEHRDAASDQGEEDAPELIEAAAATDGLVGDQVAGLPDVALAPRAFVRFQDEASGGEEEALQEAPAEVEAESAAEASPRASGFARPRATLSEDHGEDETPSRVRGTGRRLAALAMYALMGVAGVFVVGLIVLGAGPHLLPFRTVTMSSSSMEPSIPTGSLLVLRRTTAASLRLGDIISVQSPVQADVVVSHRIVGIEDTPAGPGFVTRGDANPENDPWVVPAAGEGWKFAFYVPALGRLVAGLQSTPGRALFTAGVVLLVTLVVVGRWRPRRTPAQAAG